MQKEQLELRRDKKRQRQSRIPPATAQQSATEDSARADSGAGGGPTPPIASGGPAQAPPSAPLPAWQGAPLGFRGLLNPLLFMHAPSSGAAETPESAAPSADARMAQRKNDDLRAALKRAEAEYASVLQPGPPAAGPEAAGTEAAGAPRGRAMQRPRRVREATPGQGSGARERTPATGSGRDATTEQRGKKRRPLEQEPRAVSEAATAQRHVEALPEVEAFLKKHGVRCRRYILQRSFRAIVYGQQQAKKAAGAAAAAAMPSEAPPAPAELPPWEQYLQANSFFSKHGQFVHTVAWEVEGRRILTIVPHPARVDVDVLARALQKPVRAIRQRKLKEIEKETGFPVFVCPPFGHPEDAEGRPPVLLVDSAVTELKKPLLFDCGATGLCVPVSELLRSTGAACVENLAKAAPRAAAAPQPAPQVAPVAELSAGLPAAAQVETAMASEDAGMAT
ncbi:unnamed protein product [Polarella glacialis]|uniref:YbaK/aminoacyl-tRNA synthetase-associated domain-containing protein n=1 Tax=Polarella glacialis TaxID=89957 RepID=A0A813D6J4_POLGL|nr:unnamed protein product [Polarella glacialis]